MNTKNLVIGSLAVLGVYLVVTQVMKSSKPSFKSEDNKSSDSDDNKANASGSRMTAVDCPAGTVFKPCCGCVEKPAETQRTIGKKRSYFGSLFRKKNPDAPCLSCWRTETDCTSGACVTVCRWYDGDGWNTSTYNKPCNRAQANM